MTLHDAILRDLAYSRREQERQAILKELERNSIRRLWKLRARKFLRKGLNVLMWIGIGFAALCYLAKW